MANEKEEFTLEKKIQTFIKQNGISQKFVANLIGISEFNLSATLTGRRRMKADELIIFCEHYGLNLDFFKNFKCEVGA